MVEPAEDPTALHPEIQRQAAHIRTDLDRFSLLEISGLVRHGYCVGRKACRARPDLFGAELPANAPWDPIPAQPRTAARAPTAARPHADPDPRGWAGGSGAGWSRRRPRRGADAAGLGAAAHLERLAGLPGLGLLHLRAAHGPDPRPAALLRRQVLPAVRSGSASWSSRFPRAAATGAA